MKGKEIFFIVTVIIIIIITSFNLYRLSSKNKILHNQLINFKDNWKINYLLGSKLNGNIIGIETVSESGCDYSFYEKLNGNKNLIFFYSQEVCDICDKDLFGMLSSLTQLDFYNEIITLVPNSSYRDFINFNKQYHLNLHHIFYYSNYQLVELSKISRGCFLVVDSEQRISNVYIPGKPLNKDDMKIFIDFCKSNLR